MDPIDINHTNSEQDIDSFLSEFGSRSRISRRGSRSSLSTSRKESATTNEYIESNRDLKRSHSGLWRSQEIHKISIISQQENNNIYRSKDKDIEQHGECDNLKGEEDDDDEATAKDEEKGVDEKSGRHRFTGLGLALLSCVAFSLSSLIVKYYLKDYHPFTKGAWRFQGIVLPAIPVMFYSRCIKKRPIFDTVWPPHQNRNWINITFLMVRATVGLATIILQFYALRYITLADQMVIGSSQPVFVSIVAYFMLGEKCGIVPIGVAFLTILGVVIVAKPPILTGSDSFDDDALIGSGLALCSVLASVASIVFMRRMKNIHFTLITFTFGVWGSFASAICAAILQVFQLPQGTNHILLAVAVASLVFISQTTTTIALKYEQAGIVSLTRSSNILFAFMWEYLLLDVSPGLLSLIGAAIIMIGVMIIAIRKWVSTMPENSPSRQRFSFILR